VALDVEGTEALYPTPGGLLAALEKRLATVGLETARVGLGPTRTVALLAARHRGGGHVVAPEQLARFLSPLPLDLLEPPVEVFDRLTRWGIHTLGELGRIALEPLGTRLGEQGVQLARRARGQDLLPFKPTPPRVRFEEGTETGYPVADLEGLAFFLRGLLERLGTRLRLRGLAARRLLVELVLESGETCARPVGLGASTADGTTLTRLVRLALEKDPPPEPVERLRVIATPGSVESAQLDLFLPPLPAPAELAVTVARLEALCGPGQVGAPALHDGHRPDAARVADFDSNPGPPPQSGTGRAAEPPAPAMALRALRPPQPIRVWGPPGIPERVEPRHKWNTPGEIAGGQVLERAGPWRLHGEWWGDACYARDYFDVELSDGGVYRIYRNLADESWYLDGLYD
jgi:protein ImuB